MSKTYVQDEYGFNEQEQYDLEKLIDVKGIGNTLNEIGLILRFKADHLRADWQDDISARSFEKLAKLVEKAAVTLL